MRKKDRDVNEEVDTIEDIADDSDAGLAGFRDDAAASEAQQDIPEATITDDDGAPLEGIGETDPLTLLQQERDEFRDQALRARAEFDNYRKRMARESEATRKTAARSLMRDLLPVVDNLERALSHVEDKSDGLAQGVEMILRQFADVLSAQGLDPIPAKGEPFDPNFHEALTHQPSTEYPADTVIEEFQRGYRLGDFVLRPSQVVVSSGAPAETNTEDTGTEETPGEAPGAFE